MGVAAEVTDDPGRTQRRLGPKTRAMANRYIKVQTVERVKPLTNK
jgi:hypothetical protein